MAELDLNNVDIDTENVELASEYHRRAPAANPARTQKRCFGMLTIPKNAPDTSHLIKA